MRRACRCRRQRRRRNGEGGRTNEQSREDKDSDARGQFGGGRDLVRLRAAHLGDIQPRARKAAEQQRLADAKHEADRAAESIKLLAELLPAYQTRVPEKNWQIAELHTTGVEMAKAYMQSRDAGNVLMKAPDSGFDARSSKLAAEMKTVSDEVEWQLHDATATLHVAEGDARTLVIGSSVLLVLFVTLVFAFLYFKIVPPLASLQQSLTGINTGNGDLTRRITHKG